MYDYLNNTDIYFLFSAILILPVIVVLFEEIVCGFVEFVYSFVTRVKKIRVVDPSNQNPLINPNSNKGNYDLYTRWRSRIRKNVFRLYD